LRPDTFLTQNQSPISAPLTFKAKPSRGAIGVVPLFRETQLCSDFNALNKIQHHQQRMLTSLAYLHLIFILNVGIIAALVFLFAFIIISDYAYRLYKRYLLNATKRLSRVYFFDSNHSPAANAATLVWINFAFLLFALRYFNFLYFVAVFFVPVPAFDRLVFAHLVVPFFFVLVSDLTAPALLDVLFVFVPVPAPFVAAPADAAFASVPAPALDPVAAVLFDGFFALVLVSYPAVSVHLDAFFVSLLVDVLFPPVLASIVQVHLVGSHSSHFPFTLSFSQFQHRHSYAWQPIQILFRSMRSNYLLVFFCGTTVA
jgi:hypothetical protein